MSSLKNLTGLILHQADKEDEWHLTKNTIHKILIGSGPDIRKAFETLAGRRVDHILVAPVAGYVAEILPTLKAEFASVGLADNFKAGQNLHGLECITVPEALPHIDRYDIVLLGTADAKLLKMFSTQFSTSAVVTLPELVAEVADRTGALYFLRDSLLEAYATIENAPNELSVRKFLEALKWYAFKGGEIEEFSRHINKLFNAVHPQGSAISTQHTELMNRIRCAYGAVSQELFPKGYSVGPHWIRKQAHFSRIILLFDDPRYLVICAAYNELSGFDHRVIGDSLTARSIIEDKMNAIKRDFGFDVIKDLPIDDTDFSTASGFEVFTGRKLSTMFLTHVYYFLQLRKSIEGPLSRILEIGGGYGALSRVIMAQNKAQYIIVDLPGSLVYSYTFLSLSFPQAKMFFATGSDPDAMAAALESADFIFIPPQFLSDTFGIACDLVINTMSLQEMPQETVDFYMDYIHNKISTRYFYSVNYFISIKKDYTETTALEGMSQNNLICPKLDRNWEIILTNINPWTITIDASARNWLEILVKRQTASDPKSEARKYFERSKDNKIMSNEWFKCSFSAFMLNRNSEYIKNLIYGLEYFASNELDTPNNMFNNGDCSVANRREYKPGSNIFFYHLAIPHSEAEKKQKITEIGEIIYLKTLLQD